MSRIMKALVFAFLILIAFTNTLIAQANYDVPRFSLTLTADSPEVTLGSDIGIGIKITNISPDPLILIFTRNGNVESGYQYEVRDEQGAMAAKVTEHNPPRFIGSSTRGKLKPGDGIQSGTQISDVYQFDHPGKYTIQVSRKLPGMPLVQSNIITVTVLPAGSTPAADTPAPAQQ